jgi:hypothetical protein
MPSTALTLRLLAGATLGALLFSFTPNARAADETEAAPTEDDAEPPHPWGLTAHLASGFVAEGLNQGVGHYHDAGLAGAGLALRIALTRHIALQGEGDLLGGFDTVGYPRVEGLALGSLLVFLNPNDKWQVFLEGASGLDASRITASKESLDGPTYTYYNVLVGGGLGLEWHAFERFSFSAHARLLGRARLGSLAQNDAVMRDDQGKEATYGALGMLSVGATYLF